MMYTVSIINANKIINDFYENVFIHLNITLGNWLSEDYRNLSEFWRQTAAVVFWELIAPNLMILLLFR